MQFADSDIERSDVLGSFVRLIMHGRLTREDYGPDPGIDAAHNRWARLITFMQKWDCQGPLRTFTLCVSELLLRGEVASLDAFVLGMLADDEELCVSALKVRGPAGRPLRVDDVPFRTWQRVGARYMYALACAHGGVGRGNGWTDISDAFRRHLSQTERMVDAE